MAKKMKPIRPSIRRKSMGGRSARKGSYRPKHPRGSHVSLFYGRNVW